MKRFAMLLCGFAAVLGVSAAPIRELELQPNKNVTINLGYNAEIRHDNSGAVGITYAPLSQAVTFYGLKFGEARINCLRDGSVVEQFLVKVTPVNFSIYRRMLQEHPRLRLEVGDGKVLICGPVSTPLEVETVKKMLELDAPYKQLSDNTVFDGEPLLANARKFLAERKFRNIDLRLMNKTVFLTGEVYDPIRREQLVKLVGDYFQAFGCTVNMAGVEISARKILLKVTFLDVDKSKLRDLGFKINSPVNWTLTFDNLAPFFRIGSNAEKSGMTLANISGVIAAMQANGLVQVVYENRLSTVSGEKAEFQSGGVLNVRIRGYESGSLKEIEYGFQITATPYTIDDDTIGVNFDMLDSRPKNVNTWTNGENDKDMTKYLTKSRYTIPAGHGLVVSSFTRRDNNDTQDGLPYLVDIPWVGNWLFGRSTAGATEHEIVLVLQAEWADQTGKTVTPAQKQTFEQVDQIKTINQDRLSVIDKLQD